MRVVTMVTAVLTAVAVVSCSMPRVPMVRVGDEILVPLDELKNPPPIEISQEQFERAMRDNIKAIADLREGQHPGFLAQGISSDLETDMAYLARCLDRECENETDLAIAVARTGPVKPSQLEAAHAVMSRRALTVRLATLHPAGPMDRDYAAWCVQRGEPGDCLSIGQLDEAGRKRVALSAAFSAVWAGAVDGLRDTVNPRAVETILATGMLAYLAMIVVPEPITKAAAAALTIVLVSYLGIGTAWRIISEYKELSRSTAQATDFSTILAAGRRFGSAMGDTSARVFVMLVSVAIGQTAGLAGRATGFLSKVPAMPNYGMAVAAAPTRVGIPLAVAGNVESVLIADGAISIALMPAAVTAVAQSVTTSSIRFNFGFRSYSSFKYWHGPAGTGKEWHHIVEQTEANVKAFGAERLHNRSNVVALDVQMHDKITRLYSSIAKRWTGSDTQTVREWLRGQSFEAQEAFGRRILQIVQAGGTP